MIIKVAASTVSALILCLGFATNASAGSINGSYDYSIINQTSDGSCTSPGDGLRDNFHSTSGGNSIDPADPTTFSICDGIPGFLEGGQFLITDGTGDSFAGILSGVLTGISGGGGDIFDGTFEVTSETGNYSSVTDPGGNFEVVTGEVNTEAFTNGTIEFQSTPEPLTAALAGSGLLLMGLFRRKRRA